MIEKIKEIKEKEYDLLTFYNTYFKIKAISDISFEYFKINPEIDRKNIIKSAKEKPLILKEDLSINNETKELEVKITYKVHKILKEKFKVINLNYNHKKYIEENPNIFKDMSLYQKIIYFSSCSNKFLNLTLDHIILSINTAEFELHDKDQDINYIQYYPIYGIYMTEAIYLEDWEYKSDFSYKVIKISMQDKIPLFSNQIILEDFFSKALFDKEEKSLNFIANGKQYSNIQEYFNLLKTELNKNKKNTQFNLNITETQDYFWFFEDPLQNKVSFDHILETSPIMNPLLKEYFLNNFNENNNYNLPFKPYFGTYTQEFPLGFGQHKVISNNQGNKMLNPVVGAPGTGKTTLFKSIYANNITKRALSIIEEGKDYNNSMLMVSTANKIINAVYEDLKEINEYGGMVNFLTGKNQPTEKQKKMENFELDIYIKNLILNLEKEDTSLRLENLDSKEKVSNLIKKIKKEIIRDYKNIDNIKQEITDIYDSILFEIEFKNKYGKDIEENELLEKILFLEKEIKKKKEKIDLINNLEKEKKFNTILKKEIFDLEEILNNIKKILNQQDIIKIKHDLILLNENYEKIIEFINLKKEKPFMLSFDLSSMYNDFDLILSILENEKFNLFLEKAKKGYFEDSLFNRISNIFSKKYKMTTKEALNLLRIKNKEDITDTFLSLDRERKNLLREKEKKVKIENFDIDFNMELFLLLTKKEDINSIKKSIDNYLKEKKKIKENETQLTLLIDKINKLKVNESSLDLDLNEKKLILKYLDHTESIKRKKDFFLFILNKKSDFLENTSKIEKEISKFKSLNSEEIFRNNKNMFFFKNYILFRLSELYLAYIAKENEMSFEESLKRVDNKRGNKRDIKNGRKIPFKEDFQIVSLIFPMIGTTIFKINQMNSNDNFSWRLNDKNNPIFETLIVDEAGMISSGDLIHSLNISERAFVVGDPKQLEAISNIPDIMKPFLLEKVNKKDNIEFLNKYMPSEVSCYHRASGSENGDINFLGSGVLLDEHRRCQKDIALFFKEVADYPDSLKIETFYLNKEIEKMLPLLNEKPKNILFYNTKSEKISQGNTNYSEIKKIREVLNTLNNIQKYKKINSKTGEIEEEFFDLKKHIGIITPYNSQADLLTQEFSSILGHTKDTPKIGTVHKFQGAEFPIIIFSSVLNETSKSFDFVCKNMPLLNVSISRAKALYIHVGDFESLSGKSDLMNKYLSFVKNHGKIINNGY